MARWALTAGAANRREARAVASMAGVAVGGVWGGVERKSESGGP